MEYILQGNEEVKFYGIHGRLANVNGKISFFGDNNQSYNFEIDGLAWIVVNNKWYRVRSRTIDFVKNEIILKLESIS